VGAVVVEDGAGAVDDFLVALDLRHDLLLHLQRGEGDLEFGKRRPANAGKLCAFELSQHSVNEAFGSEDVCVERRVCRSVDALDDEDVGRTNAFTVSEPDFVEIGAELSVENVARLEDVLQTLDVGRFLGDYVSLNLSRVLRDVFKAKISDRAVERVWKHGLVCFSEHFSDRNKRPQ